MAKRAGRWILFLGFLLAEVNVLGPMIALLPTWAAGWEPRFLGLFLQAATGPVIAFFLPAAIAARVRQVIKNSEERRRVALEDQRLSADVGRPEFESLESIELPDYDEGNER